ncbi:Nif3-like dinuclear metal center hexameric protein, partial [Candidatus Desantisbacteria bacterium]|nr:Nif3-like dinuclear metal center hexameric protein [Candidatus Desantisbacteria bacterium]
MVKAHRIIKIIENIAPEYLEFPGDKNGLHVGSLEMDIRSVLITLEITEGVVKEAVNYKCNLIVSHHPFIFNPIQNLYFSDIKTEIIKQLLIKKIAVYSAHSNMDSSPYGINFMLAQKIGLKYTKPILPVKLSNFKKLVIYIPVTHMDKVRDKLLSMQLFETEKYSKMSFSCSGEGTFLPNSKASPFIGVPGHLEKVFEHRLEVLVEDKNIHNTLENVRKVHPYQEMAFDIYPVENFYHQAGFGLYGEIEEAISLNKFADQVKKNLNIKSLRVVGDMNKKIKKIGVISGSGADYIPYAKNIGLNVLITGDIKHHDAHNALEKEISIIDAGHYHTEKFFKDIVYNSLKKNKDINSKISIIKSKIKT